VQVPNTTDLHLRALAASADGKLIVAVGARGRFLLSVDGGKSWRTSWVGTPEHLYAVATCGQRFWGVGANGFAASVEAKVLVEARGLIAAPPPPAKPVQKITAEQRARVRIGDFLVVSMRLKCPEMGLDQDYHSKLSVSALGADDYTLVQEIVKGTPPPGTPMVSESRVPLANLEDFSGYEVGKSQESQDGELKVVEIREPDETLTVAGKKLSCLVMKTEGSLPGGQSIVSRTWTCPAEVPIHSLVKIEAEQTITLPDGATVKVLQTMKLIEWGRGEQAQTGEQ
jgi:hypothetical protein